MLCKCINPPPKKQQKKETPLIDEVMKWALFIRNLVESKSIHTYGRKVRRFLLLFIFMEESQYIMTASNVAIQYT